MFHYDEEICKKCGGSCCKNLPGCSTPEDILKNYPSDTLEEAITKALVSKQWSVDWWEADPCRYYLRPAIKKSKILLGEEEKTVKIFDPSFGGTCVFLSETGCLLEKENRPDECKRLKPVADKFSSCDIEGESGKLYYAKIWEESGINLEEIGHKVLKIIK